MSTNIILCDSCKLALDKNKEKKPAIKEVEITDEIKVNLCSYCYNEWNNEVCNIENYSTDI